MAGTGVDALAAEAERAGGDSSTGSGTETVSEGGALLYNAVVATMVLAETRAGVFRNILSYI